MLGKDPDSGLDVTVKAGRFGPYLQLGEAGKDKDDKPKRSGIPKGVDLASIDLEMALKFLSLPRDVGVHPDSGNMITAALGQYGPYVKHDKTYANLESWEDLFSIGLNRAVTLIADKVAGKGARFGKGATRTVLKDLGEHPAEGGKIEVLSGKYGPYITHNKVNANIPKGREPASLTVQEAVDLLAERIAKGGGKPARGKAKGAGKPKADAKAKPKSGGGKAKSKKPEPADEAAE